MSRDIKEMIVQLEEERDQIVAFRDELQHQVANGELSQALADQLLLREYGTTDVAELIRHKNAYIQEAQGILHESRQEIVLKTTPVVIVLLLATALIWNYPGITGFFAAGSAQYYQFDVNQQLSSSGAIPLSIEGSITGLRISGSASGTGSISVSLRTANGTFLVAQFAPEQTPTSLTGLVTDGLDTPVPDAVNMTNESVSAEPLSGNTTTEAPAATNDSENETEPTLPELPAQNQTNETETPLPESNESNTTEETRPVILEPSPAPPEQPAETPAPLVSMDESFTRECLETCLLPEIEGPYELLVTINGEASINIDTATYGRGSRDLPAPPPTNLSNTTNEPPTPDNEIPIPSLNESSETELPQNSTGNETIPINATNSTLALGELCTASEVCSAGTCRTGLLAGVDQPARCAESTACIADTLYPANATQGQNVCVLGTPTDWIASPGSGRLEIRNGQNVTVAVLDKWGTMAVAGFALFNGIPADIGYVVRDASGTPRFAIDEQGNLVASGALQERVTPGPTAGGDLIIKNDQGTPVIVITENGTVELAGQLLTEVTFP